MSIINFFLTLFNGKQTQVASHEPLYFRATIKTAITLTARLN